MSPPRVIVVGLDSLPPELPKSWCREVMPVLAALDQECGIRSLRSTDPPVTVPAWISLCSGKDPGELGIYGFRNRRAGSTALEVVTAADVQAPRIWDLAGLAGLSSALVGVPLAFPPAPTARATATRCFLTAGEAWITPTRHRLELERRCGPYLADVPDYRSDDRARVLRDAEALTAQRFAVLLQLERAVRPDFSMLVDIGPDRLHHAALSAIASCHPRYDGASPLALACRRYYAALDAAVGQVLDRAGQQTTVIVVSDHGVQPLYGALALNEWLLAEGYLVLSEPPRGVQPLHQLAIDWSRTRAFAEGGHFGRLFLNVRGRDPVGCVSPDAAPALAAELASRLGAMKGPDGAPLVNTVLSPAACYRETQGFPPDLLVYCGDLKLRAVGSVGHGRVFLEGNDTGPDEANHSRHGLLAVRGPAWLAEQTQSVTRIDQVFGLILAALGVAHG